VDELAIVPDRHLGLGAPAQGGLSRVETKFQDREVARDRRLGSAADKGDDKTGGMIPAAFGFRLSAAGGAGFYGIRIGEVRILSPTPAMMIAGVTTSSPVK
jgi:hypothetical protein